MLAVAPVHRGVSIFLMNDIYGTEEREETRLAIHPVAVLVDGTYSRETQ